MPSILDKIATQRRLDVEEARKVVSVADLLTRVESIKAELGVPLNLHRRLSKTTEIAVAAEFKRASPSKGPIGMDLDVGEQTLTYARSGASAISILTEPKWFQGSLEDMLRARRTTQVEMKGNRPAILRKDFIVDAYQVYEAVAYGADTLLLIVAILSKPLLFELLECARSLGMEPLVEAANEEEMEIALAVGAKCIGINNRNLHTFKVDLGTSERLTALAISKGISVTGPDGLVIVALSGIACRADVERFEKAGLRGILVGEALMRAPNPAHLIDVLVGKAVAREQTRVKICGIKDPETAMCAAAAGADFIGMIFAKSKRQVSSKQAKAIVDAVRGFRENDTRLEIPIPSNITDPAVPISPIKWFSAWSSSLAIALATKKPLTVGVFCDQPLDEVKTLAVEAGIDIIQLHGDEGWDACDYFADVGIPCLRVVHVLSDLKAIEGTTTTSIAEGVVETLLAGHGIGILLDTKVPGSKEKGGTGVTFDWSIARDVGRVGIPLFLAGGLNPGNVADSVTEASPWAVDVSSGVETDGVKDLEKIKAFVQNAKRASRTG